MAERIAEFDLVNERIVLSTMIHDPKARRRLSSDLLPAEFGDPRHQVMFRALKSMAVSELAYNEDTLADLTGGQDFGGFEYVRAVVEDYEPNANVDHHLDRLRVDAAKYQVLKDVVPLIVQACEDPTSSPERLTAPARALIERVERCGKRFITGGQMAADAYYDVLRKRRLLGGQVDGFGLPLLDSTLSQGLAPCKVSLVAARPSFGKTTLLARLVSHRIAQHKGTLLCGWDMDDDDYWDMMIVAETGIGIRKLLHPDDLSAEDQEAVQDAVARFSNRDLLEIERSPFSSLPKPDKHWATNERNLDHFEATVSGASETKGLIAVDVIGNLLADKRPDAVAEALYRIKDIAKRYHVHVMMLHHINRDGADGPPKLETLKNAGAFEESTDLIIGLDRPRIRASVARRRKMVDVLDAYILKQRKGPGSVATRYRFDGARCALTDEVELDLSMLEKDEDIV